VSDKESPPELLSGSFKGDNLGVGLTSCLMVSPANDLVLFNNHGPDTGVGAGLASGFSAKE